MTRELTIQSNYIVCVALPSQNLWTLTEHVHEMMLFFFSSDYTVDSRYLEFQGTLKHFEISVPRHIRFSELMKKKKQFERSHLTNLYVIGLLSLEIYRKHCGKMEKLLLRSNLSTFPQYFYLLLDFHV